MIREAKRLLTGNHQIRREPETRYGEHADGRPAVTVDLLGPNESRTFADADQLLRFIQELQVAERWLRRGGKPDAG